MDENIFCFGVTSRSRAVPFTFKDSSTLPALPTLRPRVDSVVTSKVVSTAISDHEVGSDDSSEREILESRIIEGKSFKIDGMRYVLISHITRHEDGKIKTDEHWSKYECEDKGEDDEDLIPMQKPKPAKQLVDLPFEEIIIAITPSSSPISEKDENESYFEDVSATDSAQDPAPTPVQGMISSLLQVLAAKEPDKALIRGVDDVLIDHLHNTAVTLSDVAAILPSNIWNARTQRPFTPSLALNNRVRGKLAANIGLNVSPGRISADELEDIMLHILHNGDENHWLLHRVNEQVERFKAESEAYMFAKLTEKEKKQRAHQERQTLQQGEKTNRLKTAKEERELKRFLAQAFSRTSVFSQLSLKNGTLRCHAASHPMKT